MPTVGPATVSVPGCVRGWAMLLERFGTRPLADLLVPAIHHAEQGFPSSHLLSQAVREYSATFDDPAWHRVFEPGGRARAMGELLVQEDLGRTLRDLAAEGPDLFYKGRVGRAIADRMAADGFLTLEDLEAHSGEWGEPLSATYRGLTVYETPPPTQGLTALMTLNLLADESLARHPVHSVEHLHLLIEMVKLAYADRDRFIADPDQARVPVHALIGKAYAVRRRAAFDPGKAGAYAAGDPEGDTTGFVVADGHGNLASVIQSLYNGFGSGVVVPGTGVVLQNRGRSFTLDPSHPGCLAPGKRPFHTLMAAILTRDERPVAAFATMGGNGQAMFHAQVLTNLIDYGMDIQEAIERPRFVLGALTPDEPADTVRVEGRVERGTREALAARGHRIRVESDFYHRMGHAHGIVVRDGTLMGGADPRGDGAALGF
jgi:gamma-glutamyltranspeptidase/glutathione hydrolase